MKHFYFFACPPSAPETFLGFSIDSISAIVSIITCIGVLFAALGLHQTKKSAYFNTMTRCISNFREIMRGFQLNKFQNKSINVLKMDLLGQMNEQLYYIRKGYAERDIAIEWMITMYECLYTKQYVYHISNSDYNDKFKRVQILARYFEEKRSMKEYENYNVLKRDQILRLAKDVYEEYYLSCVRKNIHQMKMLVTKCFQPDAAHKENCV